MFMRVNSKCAHQVRPPLGRIRASAAGGDHAWRLSKSNHFRLPGTSRGRLASASYRGCVDRLAVEQRMDADGRFGKRSRSVTYDG
jgi:hypothetical protein